MPLLRAAARVGGLWRRRAITGAAAIAVAVGAGILTLATKNNWWSYTMAVGFIAALRPHDAALSRLACSRAMASKENFCMRPSFPAATRARQPPGR